MPEDFTETQSTKASSAVQSTLLGEVLEHAEIAAVVLDDAGRHVAVNLFASELTGYRREELLGRSAGELSPEGDFASQLEEIQAGRRQEGEFVVRRKDGRDLRVRYRAAKSTLARLPFIVAFFWAAG